MAQQDHRGRLPSAAIGRAQGRRRRLVLVVAAPGPYVWVMSGGFPIDLIIFGMVAAFLVLRLRSILGRRQGFERPPQPLEPRAPADARSADGPIVDAPAIAQVGPAKLIPDARTPAGQALARIRGVDPGFDADQFLDGATAAFAMIVEAFARGDRAGLKQLLAPELYIAFEQAISAREAARETLRQDITALREVSIIEADLRGTIASLTVRFVSDQINSTRDATGQVVHGSDVPTETVDIWTFERDLRAADPTWLLVATRSE
jgi:predicted lipid-binding transport protein (Tim44 family)